MGLCDAMHDARQCIKNSKRKYQSRIRDKLYRKFTYEFSRQVAHGHKCLGSTNYAYLKNVSTEIIKG